MVVNIDNVVLLIQQVLQGDTVLIQRQIKNRYACITAIDNFLQQLDIPLYSGNQLWPCRKVFLLILQP